MCTLVVVLYHLVGNIREYLVVIVRKTIKVGSPNDPVPLSEALWREIEGNSSKKECVSYLVCIFVLLAQRFDQVKIEDFLLLEYISS